MILSDNSGALKKFRKNAGIFQQTFETPLKDLSAFVSTILDACETLRSASVTLDQVVFEPTNLRAMLERYARPPRYEHGVMITAEGRVEVNALLCSTLADWIDFLFVPQPRSFFIYADHDEFTTFYAHKRGNLNRVTAPLLAAGFKLEADYEREF